MDSHAISDRVRLQRALTADLASYFLERAAVEESYVHSLHKLHSRLRSSSAAASSGGGMLSSSSSSHVVMGNLAKDTGLSRMQIREQLGAWEEVLIGLERETAELARCHDVRSLSPPLSLAWSSHAELVRFCGGTAMAQACARGGRRTDALVNGHARLAALWPDRGAACWHDQGV